MLDYTYKKYVPSVEQMANLTFLKVSGTIGAVNSLATIYTHPTSLSGYMIVGWNIILGNVKYIWQSGTILEMITIDSNNVKVKNLNAEVVGATIEILLYKIPT